MGPAPDGVGAGHEAAMAEFEDGNREGRKVPAWAAQVLPASAPRRLLI
jgi:hypothetical protein